MPQIGAFAFIAMAASTAMALTPRASDREVLVAFAPWTSQARAWTAVAIAGGEILTLHGPAFLVAARASDPGFVRRVRAEGAVVVIRAGIGLGCGRSSLARPSR